MRPPCFYAASLLHLLKKKKIATLAELKDALGCQADLTVLRKLKELDYRTSYSHRGRFYTLNRIARFSPQGLWSFRDARFSSHGTLLETAAAFVHQGKIGYFSDELESLLRVQTREALLHLVCAKRISREKVLGRFLYCSSQIARKRMQIALRQGEEGPVRLRDAAVGRAFFPDDILAAIVLFASLLDERQRRLYAGLESLKVGHGGDARVAQILGIDPGTVARGRCQLMNREILQQRQRKSGAGRKRMEKKRPPSSRD